MIISAYICYLKKKCRAAKDNKRNKCTKQGKILQGWKKSFFFLLFAHRSSFLNSWCSVVFTRLIKKKKKKRQSCPLVRTSGLGAGVQNFATKIKDSMSPTRVCCTAQQRHSTVQWHFQHACFCIRVDDGWGRDWWRSPETWWRLRLKPAVQDY